MSSVPGGFRTPEDANDEVQEIINHVKPSVEEKLGKGQLNNYKAVKYSTQVVAGTNYLVKVQLDNNEVVHLKVHKPLPFKNEKPFLLDIKENESLESPLI